MFLLLIHHVSCYKKGKTAGRTKNENIDPSIPISDFGSLSDSLSQRKIGKQTKKEREQKIVNIPRRNNSLPSRMSVKPIQNFDDIFNKTKTKSCLLRPSASDKCKSLPLEKTQDEEDVKKQKKKEESKKVPKEKKITSQNVKKVVEKRISHSDPTKQPISKKLTKVISKKTQKKEISKKDATKTDDITILHNKAYERLDKFKLLLDDEDN
uniref:Uncharacterized protein n=1 Tax=Parastrongyloides trichosuri TaxID=131310 RepID=A0A0N4Z921_PARTI